MKITQASLTLNFCCNRINHVPSNAFSNLEFTKANSTVTLDLQLSELKDIDLHAFRGIESLMTSLNLDSNYLTQIPLAVGTLKNLQMLRIRNNPIATVDPFVTSGIAHSLIFLDLDMDHFQSWPTSFSNLVALQVLKMSYVTLEFRDMNIFHGFVKQFKGTSY
jgi:Leucine-rich repeat (LRR) protein